MYLILFQIIFQKRVTELEKIKTQFEDLKQQVQGLDETKGWLERRLKETEVYVLFIEIFFVMM
jgi:hypothetical protein